MGKKRRDTPEWQWEQALIDACADHCWRKVFNALHEHLHQWERGELTNDEMDNRVHAAHKQTQEAYKSLNYPKRDDLVLYAQFDDEWFQPWLAQHPPPLGATLAPVREMRAFFPAPRADGRDGDETCRD
jgi:hypothetical protein